MHTKEMSGSVPESLTRIEPSSRFVKSGGLLKFSIAIQPFLKFYFLQKNPNLRYAKY